MDPLQSPFVGFSWGRTPPSQTHTPIPQNPMDFEIPEDFSDVNMAGTATFPHQSHNAHHSATPDPIGFHKTAKPSARDGENAQSPHNETAMRSRRARHAGLDWEGHKARLFELYIKDELVLTETMKIMKNSHDFDAPPKAYKEKFRTWGWRRNLPGAVAHWMVDRAAERQSTGRRTEFEFGGQRWSLEQATSSANRTRKQNLGEVATPDGVIVVTPEGHFDLSSPKAAHSPQMIENLASPSVVFVAEGIAPKKPILPLNFNGKNTQDLGATRLAARDYQRNGELVLAEELYIEAFRGFQNILSPTNPEAIDVGCELATFYFQHDRRTESDGILEEMATEHIETHGINHKMSQQYILRVAELLNGWNRGADALAFLLHAQQLAERLERNSGTTPASEQRGRDNPGLDNMSSNTSGQRSLERMRDEIAKNPSVATIDHGLDTARLATATNEPAVLELLIAIENQSFKDAARFTVQGIRARAERLKYYVKHGLALENQNIFLASKDFLQIFWVLIAWDSSAFKTHEVIEASLEVGVGVLRGNCDHCARDIFREISAKVTNLYGFDDERTIWTAISIGIGYQKYRTFDDARFWFQQAWAAADTKWGNQDGVTRSLENAMHKQHFSYISDEGRPFKTVFGVCGFTVRPSRLHLE